MTSVAPPLPLPTELFAAMTEGVVVLDATGGLVCANQSATTILGMTEDQIAGRAAPDPAYVSMYPDGTPLGQENHPGVIALRTGLPQRDLTILVRGPEGTKTVRVNVQPLFSNGSRMPTHVVATFTDVTDQVRATRELEEREAFFRQLAETSTAVIFLCDTTGALRYVNPAWTTMTGRSSEAAMGNGWLESIHPDDIGFVYGAWVDACARGAGLAGIGRYVGATGQIHHVDARIEPIRGPGGENLGWVGTLLDISDRIHAERDRDQFFATSTDLGLICSADGTIHAVNKALGDALGWSVEELTRVNYYTLLHPDDLAKADRNLARIGAGDDLVDEVVRWRHHDGHWVRISWRCFAPASTAERLVGCGRVVSESWDEAASDVPMAQGA